MNRRPDILDDTISNAVLFNRKQHTKRGHSCPLGDKSETEIDYKNIQLLKKYTSEKGRILPSRVSSVSTKNQRKLKLAIRRARKLALLPFTIL